MVMRVGDPLNDLGGGLLLEPLVSGEPLPLPHSRLKVGCGDGNVLTFCRHGAMHLVAVRVDFDGAARQSQVPKNVPASFRCTSSGRTQGERKGMNVRDFCRNMVRPAKTRL